MSLTRKLFVGVLAVVLLTAVTLVFLPVQSVTVQMSVALSVAFVGGYLVAQLTTGRVDEFFGEFRSVADAATEESGEKRMGLYVQSPLNEASRSFNQLINTFDERRQQLREERNKFVSILDQLSDGVVAVDEDERVLYMNEEARDLLDVSDYHPDDDPLLSEISRDDTLQSAISRCLDAGESVHREGKRVAPDREINLTIDASVLTDRDGRVVGAVAALHDVTELRRLQTVRQDFVANVSHELKTPITAIQGYSETLADDEAMDPDTRRRFTRKIRDQVRRMSRLVEDLLTISKLESDEGELETKRLDLTSPLRDALEAVRPRAEDKGIELESSLPEDSVYVRGDPAGLRQIATNLLENAVKYTPEDGTVTLDVRRSDDRVVLTVEDTGIGIEPRKQDRIFERFYRVDSGRARSEGGTGLGLAIVKHLVLTMDGEIEVDSTPGQGSVFRVRLPGE